MQWNIPGTVLRDERENAGDIPARFSAMFLPGGMMLGQVAALTGLEPYRIQNWVRRGFLSPPRQKKYSLRQLCRILNINMLKGALPMDRICMLLQFVNGALDDESDDIIDDTDLYFMFVNLAAQVEQMQDSRSRQALLENTLCKYEEPQPGARERVGRVLEVMLTAWLAASLSREAEARLTELLEE